MLCSKQPFFKGFFRIKNPCPNNKLSNIFNLLYINTLQNGLSRLFFDYFLVVHYLGTNFAYEKQNKKI